MAAITTVLAAGALAVGAAGAVSATSQAKKARSDANAEADKQETRAIEAASLNNTKSSTGASVVFGTSKASDDLLRRGNRRKSTAAPANTVVGGL